MNDVDLHLTQEEEHRILDEGTRHVLRSSPLGRTWDTFRINGKQFELIDVSERLMGTLASTYYRLEECTSPEDFIRQWKAGHSGRWDPEQMLYIHWFRDIAGDSDGDLI